MLGLAHLDWLVMIVYASAVIAIGVFVHLRQRTSEDYFLGGRRLAWWAVGISLVATSFSSVSLVGGTGFGYTTGLKWLQLQIGDLVALIAVCVLFLPFFSQLRITTAYEYLEKRFGGSARTLASSLFLAQTVLRASVLVYGPAIVLATILSWPVETAILVSASAAVLYSAFGGIGAVVWTDLIQLATVLFAVGFCLVLVATDVPGGFGAVLAHASLGEKLEVVTLSTATSTPFNLYGATIPYAVFALSLFGTGQQAVQRFLSVRNLASARAAALTAWGVGTAALGLTLFLGAAIASWAELAPTAEGFVAAKGDDVLPAFVLWRLPAGIAGLMLAAVFAASMSSLDSAIHSMSTSYIVDFQRRLLRRPLTPKVELLIARFTTVGFGLLAVVGALYAARAKTQILETLITWLGYFAGPLLGLFLLGMTTRRATESGALAGTIVAFALVLGCGLPGWPPEPAAGLAPASSLVRSLGFHPLWLAPFSAAVTFLIGLAASVLDPPPDGGKLNGLTIWNPRG